MSKHHHASSELRFIGEKLESMDTEKPKVILVSTGSFNPVHHLHISILEAAKKFVDDQGWDYICSLMCPSADEYVLGKLSRWAIPFRHRENLIKLMLSDSPLKGTTFVSKAESHMNLFYGSVLTWYKETLVRRYPKHDLKVMYVCGTDRPIWSFLSGIWESEGVIMIERPGYNAGISVSKFSHIHVLPAPEKDDISSSKIREEGHDSELVKHREVAHYLKAYNLLVACTCGGRWEGKECECGTGDNEEIEDRDDYKDYDASEDKDSEESNKDGNSANDDN